MNERTNERTNLTHSSHSLTLTQSHSLTHIAFALTNTITALCGSTIVTFAVSAMYSGMSHPHTHIYIHTYAHIHVYIHTHTGKLRAVDVQNATLAGGVTIGHSRTHSLTHSFADLLTY